MLLCECGQLPAELHALPLDLPTCRASSPLQAQSKAFPAARSAPPRARRHYAGIDPPRARSHRGWATASLPGDTAPQRWRGLTGLSPWRWHCRHGSSSSLLRSKSCPLRGSVWGRVEAGGSAHTGGPTWSHGLTHGANPAKRAHARLPDRSRTPPRYPTTRSSLANSNRRAP